MTKGTLLFTENEIKTGDARKIIQAENIKGYIALDGWDYSKDMYTNCYRCDKEGNNQGRDEHLNRFTLQPAWQGGIWAYRFVSGNFIETEEEIAARAARKNEWNAGKVSVTLTNAQWSSLFIYLCMTTSYREREHKCWSEMAQEVDEQGKKKYPNSESNAVFWKDMIKKMDEISVSIDRRHML